MAKVVLQGAGTQPLRTYVDRLQAIVAEWVVLWPIFNVCKIYTGYKGGERDSGCRGGGRNQRIIS